MLLCKQKNCGWYLVYVSCWQRYLPLQGNDMSKTASVALSSRTTWFGRFLALIDHILMTNARIANRNGDLPYFGL